MNVKSLSSVAEGEMGTDRNVLVIKRIRVTYHLDAEGDREAIERVLSMHAEYCPVARTLAPGVAIETSLAE